MRPVSYRRRTPRAGAVVALVDAVREWSKGGRTRSAGSRAGAKVKDGEMVWINDWTAHAACRSLDPDALFVQGAAQKRAKAICFRCPVRAECLADALDNRVEFGVWGGMTERERRALLRRRPNVTSWRRLLATAMEEFERSHPDRISAAS